VRKRVTEAADVLEPHEHLDRKPANLSGGQRQRVAMGRAIVRQADAFLFDDVTEWLGDSQFAYIPFDAPEEVTTRLRELSRELDGDRVHTQAVVSIDVASRMREGREADFWLDTSRVHVFDPGTGENLTRDADAGAELIRMAEENWTEQLEEGRREAASVSG
jgi:ABC-type arginine transport system ATPase subunit